MDDRFDDLYTVLGVDPGSTPAQVGRAYRNLVRAHHPDTRPVGDTTHAAASDAALHQVLAAYAVLGDPQRRAAYDRSRGRRGWGTGHQDTRHPSRVSGPPPIRVGPLCWHPPTEPPTNRGR